MKPLHIVFSRSSNLFAAAIRAYPPSGPYSHCSVLLPEEGNRVIETLASKGGVVDSNLDKLKSRCSTFTMVSIDVPDYDKGIAWLKSTVGEKYDWSYVAGIPFRKREWDAEGKWACSEHVAVLTRKCGLDIVSDKLHGLTPNHLFSLLYAAGARELT